MNKKWMASILALVLAFATLGATVMPAFAKAADRHVAGEANEAGKNFSVTVGEKIFAELGNAVISMAKSPYRGELDLSRMTGTRRTELRAGNIEFVLPGIVWEVDNSVDKPVKFARGAWVSFHLSQAQMASGLSIYYRPLNGTTWTKLPTIMHSDKATGGAAFYARTKGFGTYGLGMAK